MNYPVWECQFANGGFIVAVIAIIHMYIAHFAIGGGLFLVATEYIGYKKEQVCLVEYVKYNTFFFLILTTVFGSLTGVGIWFCISVVSPSATSTLLSNFVFVWAIEWLFFIGELITLLLYCYCFNKISQKEHLRIGIFYCIFSWLSLFTINGIISFMLTPGLWVTTGSLWDAFFNPTMLPSLGFRTFLAGMLAGLFGFASSVFITNTRLRTQLTDWCAKWTLMSLILSIPFLWWYLSKFPLETGSILSGGSPEISRAWHILWLSITIILILIIFITITSSNTAQKLLALFLLFTGFIYIGSFEWIREASRRPYLIPGHTYSNSIQVSNTEHINASGILEAAKWVKNRQISEANIIESGGEIFKIQCLICHSIGGPINDILKATENFNIYGLNAQISGQGKLKKYMPQFFGTEMEKLALSRFIVEKLHHKDGTLSTKISINKKSFTNLSFDSSNAKYVLIGAAQYGISEIQKHETVWSMEPPPNTIYAQLILRGINPKIICEDVTITYDIGLASGTMILSEEQSAFYTNQAQITIGPNDSIHDRYPLVTLTARENTSGNVLAQTQIVMTTSTEIGCKNCHGGDWRYTDHLSGISKHTAENILKTHDKLSKTYLFQMSKNDKLINCRSCHNKYGKHLNLSTAIHGFHSIYMSNETSEDCNNCHSTGNNGYTRSFRGVHNNSELKCLNCHSNLSNMAISLLKNEFELSKPSAEILLNNVTIKKNNFENFDSITPRKPWVNLPDCLNCHFNFEPPETDEYPMSKWTTDEDSLFKNKVGKSGIMCINCHGSPHALYPATNLYNDNLDNAMALQYQEEGAPLGSGNNCQICHTAIIGESIHHFKKL